jgi:hypothetical protein
MRIPLYLTALLLLFLLALGCSLEDDLKDKQLAETASDLSADGTSNSNFPAFVVVGDSGTILTSADGSTWTNKSLFNGPSLDSIASTDDVLLASGSAGIVTTSDGSTWTARSPGFNPQTDNGSSSSSSSFALLSTVNNLWTSSDGTSWSQAYALPSGDTNMTSVSFVGDKFFTISEGVAAASWNLASSTDGTSWSIVTTGSTVTSTPSLFAKNLYVAVGGIWSFSGYPGYTYSYTWQVATSSDGASWSLAGSGNGLGTLNQVITPAIKTTKPSHSELWGG